MLVYDSPEVREEKLRRRKASASLAELNIGGWELNPRDPLAPCYDAYYSMKQELKRIFKSPQDFREGLSNARYHFFNLFLVD